MLREGLRDSVTVIPAGVSVCGCPTLFSLLSWVESKLQHLKKLFIYLLIFGFAESSLLCVGFLQLPCAGFSLQ